MSATLEKRATPETHVTRIPVAGDQQVGPNAITARTGLIDVRQAMCWVVLAGIVIGAAINVHTFGLLAVNIPKAFVVGVVALAMLVPIGLRVIRAIDSVEIQPLPIVVAALLWGGAAATGFAVVANSAMIAVWSRLGLADWSDSFSAPTDEETFKLLGVVALLYITRRRGLRPIDGLIYGALVGLGFEVVENIVYCLHAAQGNPDTDVLPAITTALQRSTIGFGGHAVFTGISGLGVATALVAPRLSTRRRWGIAVAAIALAWALHFVWDSPIPVTGLGQWAILGLHMVIVVLAAVLAIRIGRAGEHAWIRDVLAGEPADVVGPGDLDTLTSHSGYRHALARARRTGHRRGRRAVIHLRHAQVVLAGLLRIRPAHAPLVERQRTATRALRARAVALHAVEPGPALVSPLPPTVPGPGPAGPVADPAR